LATVAGMVTPTQRGTAYGIFNTAYGFSWFSGTAMMGILYEADLWHLVAFSVGLELLSVLVLLALGRYIVRAPSR
jgi:hypothetical protein